MSSLSIKQCAASYCKAVADLKDGNLEALSDFCDLIRPDLMRYFISRGCQHFDANDLAQETLLTFLEEAHTIRKKGDEKAVKSWIFTVARRKLERFQRVFKRDEKLCMPLAFVFAPLADKSPPPPKAMENKELWAAVASLPHPDVIVYRFVQGASYKAMSAQLGESIPTVGSRLRRGKKALAKKIKLAPSAA